MAINPLGDIPPRGAIPTEPNRGGVMTLIWYEWLRRMGNAVTALVSLNAAGISVTIVTAKLTGGGSNGSMTFSNGVLTAHTDAT